METLKGYQKLIQEATNCKENEVEAIEDIMRNVIVHSTLDWLSKPQFNKAAKEAHETYLFMESEEGKKHMIELFKQECN